jgi:hypothetical protein
MDVVRHGTVRERIAASRALIYADSINARREGHAIHQQTGSQATAASLLRGALTGEQARALAEQLCNLAPQLLADGPAAPAPGEPVSAPPAQPADPPMPADDCHL